MQFTTIFFDLDDTLYSARSGLWAAIKERMNLYMHERLGIALEDIPRLREQYFQQYGTTLRGLEQNYTIDASDYLAFVHKIPLTDYIQPDPSLREVLNNLTARKLVFTNADRDHASRVLNILQIEDCFEAIVDVNVIAPYCKPMPEAFDIALKIAGESDPRRCVMIDDLPRTTRTARELGMFAVLVGESGPHPDADATLSDWSALPDMLNGRRI